ncbi:PEGA domain-containing protein [Haladaptatus sp. DYF46]|uniref:PEGA domain-containing protein n=1 Tax=Haladaptatus sp. DYF46 TaxID=2886041 RepID=UPI001E437253|nr:PEGA domain-containing protein [Haladaptatus sp. DYF46]
MNRHRSIAVVLVLSVLLAGCAGLGGTDTTTTTTTTDAPTATSTSAATTTSSNGGTTTTTETTTTAASTTETTTTTVESWSPPKSPNTPLDDKRNGGKMGRLKKVTLVDKVKAKNGNGYSNFNVEVVANTSLPNVDPEPLVDGDPYFLVRINGKNVGRTGVRFQHDEGTYSVEIEEGAFEQFNDGTLKVTVYMLDEDHQHDDIYGKWTGTITYSSK